MKTGPNRSELAWLDDLMQETYKRAGLTKARYEKRFYTQQRLIRGPQDGQTMRLDPEITTWVPNIEGHQGRYVRKTDTSFHWKADR